jgi:hypothetical protein
VSTKSQVLPQSEEANISFYAWRRQYVDKIIFEKTLKPVEKLIALDIARACNRQTRLTYESYSRFAKRLGMKLRVVRETADHLRSEGRLGIEQRHGRTELRPLTKGDAQSRSTSSTSKQFYTNRGQFMDAILHLDLTPSARIAYCGIAALTDPTTGRCHEGQAEIGRQVGIPRRTMTEAVRLLLMSGVLTRESDPSSRGDVLTVHNPAKTFKSLSPSRGIAVTLASTLAVALAMAETLPK